MPETDCIVTRTDDAHLIARAIADDQSAYEELLRRYTPLVIGYLRRRAPRDYEDLYQEVMLSAFERLERVRQPDRFGAWIVRIARSKLVDLKRRQAIDRARIASGDGPDGRVQAGPSEGIASIRNPQDLASESEITDIVERAILDLPERYHLVLHLRFISGEAIPSIAATLGLKESTVKMRLQRGTARVRKSLRQKGL